MSTMTTRYLMIIPSAMQVAANQAFKAQVDPIGGENTFTQGLNASGLATDAITHYWSSIVLNGTQAAACQAISQSSVPGLVMEAYDLAITPNRPSQVLASLNLQPITAAEI